MGSPLIDSDIISKSGAPSILELSDELLLLGSLALLRLEPDGRVSLRFGDEVVYFEKPTTLEGAKAQLVDAAWIIASGINALREREQPELSHSTMPIEDNPV